MGSLVGQAALWSAAVFAGECRLGEASRAPNDRLSPPVARGEPVARVLRTDWADARYPAGQKTDVSMRRQTRNLIESVLTLTLIAASLRHRATFQRLGGSSRSRQRAHESSRDRRRGCGRGEPPLRQRCSMRPPRREGRRYGPFIATADAGDDDPHLVVGFRSGAEAAGVDPHRAAARASDRRGPPGPLENRAFALAHRPPQRQ